MTIHCVSRHTRRWTAVALSSAIAGTLALTGASSGAGASFRARQGKAAAALVSPARTVSTRLPSAPAVHPDGVSAGTYLAGYQATPPGGVSSASATFTVPKVTCTKKDEADNAEFDFGVYMNDFSAWSWIGAGCGTGGAFYLYYLATPSGQTTEPATAGDTVVTSLSASATATFAEIHDLTNHQYWLNDYTGPVDESVVDIGSFNLLAQSSLPVPAFPEVTLSNATANGDYLGFESPTEYNALNGAVTLVKTGGIKTSATGSSFSLTFEHAS
jgi:hypothetical protein